LLGQGLILLAAGLSAVGAAFSLAGGDPARAAVARRAAHATLAALVVAMVLLWVALFSRDFSIAFVASQTTTATPFLYTFTALWGGLAGSLLLWCAVLAGYGVADLHPGVVARLRVVAQELFEGLEDTIRPRAQLDVAAGHLTTPFEESCAPPILVAQHHRR
jgi:cytochrome c biogenesis factor